MDYRMHAKKSKMQATNDRNLIWLTFRKWNLLRMWESYLWFKNWLSKGLTSNFKYEHCVKDVDNAVKDQIIQHWKVGYKIKRVASIFGIDETLSRLVINQYNFEINLKRKNQLNLSFDTK